VKSWLASSGTVKESFSGTLEDTWHNHFRTLCAKIKEVKTTNMKGSDKQEDKPSPHPPFSFISAPSDVHLFEVCTPWTTFCRQPKNSMHKELVTLQQSFMQLAYSL
jgi:hypothetical protein